MIIRPAGEHLEFYTQVDHAAAAAQLGSRLRPRHNPLERVVETVRLHDAAWEEPDRQPTVLEDGAPRDFLNMEAAPVVGIWSRSILGLLDHLGPLSALVVSRHFCRLGRKAAGSESRQGADALIFQAFVQEQESLHETWRMALGAVPDAIPAEQELSGMLQLLDTITVMMLSRGQARGIMGEPLEIRLNGGASLSMRLMERGERAMDVDPWLFTEEMIELNIPCRLLPSRSYRDDSDLRQAFEAAPLVTRNYEVSIPQVRA